MTIKTIIIDDERKAIEILKDSLQLYCPQVEIIATTQSPIEGIELISTLEPHMVFLDIAMPTMSGFDVLAEIEKPNFEIVFVTAFENFALEAIKYCAIGYLVKPFDDNDLLKAVERSQNNILRKEALEKNKLLLANLTKRNKHQQKIAIPLEDGLEFVKIQDIIHCEGINGYTKIYLTKEKYYISSYSIGHYKDLLDEQIFQQVHKSHLVNMAHVQRYKNAGFIELTNKQIVPVSKNRRLHFLKIMKGSKPL